MAFYDGTKLLSQLDLNGKKPEIYLCTTNRTGGKTTFFGRMIVKRFLKTGEKFCLLYRYKYELDDVANAFFKDIGALFFPDYQMESKREMNGMFQSLHLIRAGEKKSKPCGYAIAINSADTIKKRSHLFQDATCILFDEFQSETNHYCTDEINKFISIHTSLARGNGKQVRYLPAYLLSNTVTILNPYYVALGVSGRLRDDTKFLKGDGFVLEQGFVESAAEALKDSSFNRAFAKSSYVNYASQAVYLNDNLAFLEKPNGQGRYIATLKDGGTHFSIWEYRDQGVMYCDSVADLYFPLKIAVTTEDHNVNYVMLKSYVGFVETMRDLFNRGCFRFRNLACKNAVLHLLSY